MRAARKAIVGVTREVVVKRNRGISCGSCWEGSYEWRKREELGGKGEAITSASSSL